MGILVPHEYGYDSEGDRNDIEREVYLKNEDETNFNLELTRIAGEKFFCWIRDLMESGKYDYDSIFALILDFDKCKKAHGDKYDDFIEMFQIGFEKKMEKKTSFLLSRTSQSFSRRWMMSFMILPACLAQAY